MGVYALVFTKFMPQKVEHYTFFMFVGLLPWIWFSSSVGAGASTISDRRDLLTKVRFPAQVLPATVVVTNLCNFLLSVPLMLGLGLVLNVHFTWHAVFFPVIVLIQLLFTLALAYIFSALNVLFRDLQHILANLLNVWFYATPVIYMASNISEHTLQKYGWIFHVNPMAVLVMAYQDILYHHRLPNLTDLGGVALFSLALLWVATTIFERRREEFAELI